MKQFIAFVRKEFYHVLRDKKTLLLLFGMPIAQILLFGFALTNEIKNTQIAIFDSAGDEASRQIIDRFDASPYFIIGDLIHHPDEIETTFKNGKTRLVIVFPPNFRRDLLQNNTAQIQLIADATDPNTANTLTFYAQNIISEYQRELLGAAALPMNIQINTRMIYNPELRGSTNFVPGLMALVLLLISVLMTSVSIVREKERGTMEVLLVSPFNPILVVLSKATPYLLLSIFNLIMIVVLSVFVLDMPIHGNLFLLFGVSSLFIITCLSLGLLISTIAQSQQAAMLISLMGMLLPTVLLTGFMFPLENMPIALQVVANIVPSKWYYIITKAIMIKGLGFEAIWKESLILFGMAFVLMTISIVKFNRRVS